jgi:hypothetical protein
MLGATTAKGGVGRDEAFFPDIKGVDINFNQGGKMLDEFVLHTASAPYLPIITLYHFWGLKDRNLFCFLVKKSLI